MPYLCALIDVGLASLLKRSKFWKWFQSSTSKEVHSQCGSRCMTCRSCGRGHPPGQVIPAALSHCSRPKQVCYDWCVYFLNRVVFRGLQLSSLVAMLKLKYRTTRSPTSRMAGVRAILAMRHGPQPTSRAFPTFRIRSPTPPISFQCESFDRPHSLHQLLLEAGELSP